MGRQLNAFSKSTKEYGLNERSHTKIPILWHVEEVHCSLTRMETALLFLNPKFDYLLDAIQSACHAILQTHVKQDNTTQRLREDLIYPNHQDGPFQSLLTQKKVCNRVEEILKIFLPPSTNNPSLSQKPPTRTEKGDDRKLLSPPAMPDICHFLNFPTLSIALLNSSLVSTTARCRTVPVSCPWSPTYQLGSVPGLPPRQAPENL